jgi:DNA-directed RNA polymerase subunit RPC12/RpoP
MAIQFKQRCSKCKKNFVLTTSRQSFVVCYDCSKEALKGEITVPSYKKLFNIPEEYYKENAFLRSIKVNYLRYHNLTDRQIETFKKVAAKMKEEKG